VRQQIEDLLTGQQEDAGEETVNGQAGRICAARAPPERCAAHGIRGGKHLSSGPSHQRQIASRSSSLWAPAPGHMIASGWISTMLAIATRALLRSRP